MRDYQKTSLHDVEVEIRVGLCDWERRKKQKVLVDVDLYRFKGAFTAKKIKDCLDYDRPYKFITESWPKRPHTDLLETLAEDLAVFCLRDKKVEAVRVCIRKPQVYKGKAVPAVEFFRARKKK